MPATHSAKVNNAGFGRDCVLSIKQPKQSVHKREEPCDDLNLTVSFLGCPSNSTRISIPHRGLSNSQQSYGENDKGDQSSKILLTDDCFSTKVFKDSESAWQQEQEQNNNRCSGPSEETSENHCNDSGEHQDEIREISRFRTSIGHSVEEHTATTVSSASFNESAEQNEELATNDEAPRFYDHTADDLNTGIGFQATNTRAISCTTINDSTLQLLFGEAKSNNNSNQEDCSTGQHAAKSTPPVSGCGRPSVSRMQRSPQRYSSPSRRKRGNHLCGSSAPVPILPTPAQNSFGRTNINRPSSVSPTRRESSEKSSPKRGSPALDSFIKVTNFRSRESHGSADPLSDMLRSVSVKPPSTSIAAQNLYRHADSVEPTQSVAESDLRERKPTMNQSESPESSVNYLPIKCHLILPDEPWTSRAPHGDIQQTSPLKILEMTRMNEQQQAFNSNRIKDPAKLTASEIEATASYQKSGARNAKSTLCLEDKKASLSPSHSTSAGSTSGRQRPSRRHPVLDKMFRHVLASLMMESGPPSSACLASVLDRVEGAGTSDSLRSQSKSFSSVSSTNTFKSRLSNSRFSKSRFSSGLDIHGVESGSTDMTLSSLSGQLPCDLRNISE
ncbi:hypothetical protein EGW08_013960 [Elysia chlorotica]|uniref:Uncharacterized protein n=1 Tax=Elysia chlorotica TaxID=188477 RepID=A0A3S1B845_ELYCH|nr:hypothetical protein EGW08_013960 [Elysia chlorotica]